MGPELDQSRKGSPSREEDRPLYPLAYRLQVLGIGMTVLGAAFLLVSALETTPPAMGSLLFGYLFCASGYGVAMVMFSAPRLRGSLSTVRPAHPDAHRRSRREILLRTVAFLACVAASIAVLQPLSQALHTSLAIAPGILTGSGGLALWNRTTVLQWEAAHRRTVLAQSELQWTRAIGPLFAINSAGR